MIQYIFRNSWWAIRKRPKIIIGFTLFDLILEIAGLVAFLAMWIFVIATYSGLPDTIPTHFNGSGQADNFGNKSGIFFLPVVATAVYAGMTILSRFPHVLNYPVKITEDNACFQYRNMITMVRYLKLVLVLLFGFFILQMVLNTGNGIGMWLLPVLLAIIVVPVIYFMVKSFIYR